MKYIMSCSFGKDSLALLLKLIELKYPLDEVIYFDIGVEFDSIGRVCDQAAEFLAENNIEFTILHPKENFLYMMTEKDVVKRDGSHQKGYEWCGGPCRWGTALKINAMKEHYKKYDGETIVEYIGLASDERNRINRDRQSNLVKLYPLIEWGMTEQDCLDYCHDKGFYWMEDGKELYNLKSSDGLDRISCKYCSNKNLKELRYMYHNMPTVWGELRNLQEKIKRPFKDGKTVFELEERFKNEPKQLSFFDFFEV